MPEPTVELTLHLMLPVTQIEPLLRYLRAYPGDPADTIKSSISLDARYVLDQAEAVALLRRLDFPIIIEDPRTATMDGFPAQEDPDAP